MAQCKAVHKFRVPIDMKWHEVSVPYGATLLHVGKTMLDKNQEYLGGVELGLYFWAEVLIGAEEVPQQFRAFATGELIPLGSATYVGTCIDDGMVWHLYLKTDD